jgi:hypothetical protein
MKTIDLKDFGDRSLIVMVLLMIIAIVLIYFFEEEPITNINSIEVPKETMFRLACEYHGIEQAYFNKNISTFYFNRDDKNCLLFTAECVEWIEKQPQIDKFWEGK